jgi:hypothetical protein
LPKDVVGRTRTADHDLATDNGRANMLDRPAIDLDDVEWETDRTVGVGWWLDWTG